MILKTIKNEDGFWTVISILLLAVLALMGLASYVLTRSEGKSVVNKVFALQAEYAANGGVYYGLKRLQVGPLDETQQLSIGGSLISVDTTKIDTLIQLTVTSIKDGVSRSIRIELTEPKNPFTDLAMVTEGDIDSVSAYDEDFNPDPDRMDEFATEMPSIDLAALKSAAIAQGHHYTADLDIVSDYLTSFFRADGSPNVTYVDDQLTIKEGVTVYGIFVVEEGAFIVEEDAQVHGVVYNVYPGKQSDIKGEVGQASIIGGIIGRGVISGVEGSIVQHWSEYLEAFYDQYQQGGSGMSDMDIVSWRYLQ